MPERSRGRPLGAWCLAAVASALVFGAGRSGAQPLPHPPGPRLGQAVSPAEAQRGQWTVFPDGRGLPAGRGTAAQGAEIFRQQCAACHGDRGRGASAEELVGGSEPLTSRWPDKTIGLYWPYATTLFDMIRRSMPMFAPGSLDADTVYALTAYLLAEDGVIAEADEMNAVTLPAVKMPNRNGFVPVPQRVP